MSLDVRHPTTQGIRMGGGAMSRYTRLAPILLLGVLMLSLGAAGRAADKPIPFETAMVFFELNNGTGQPVDLGFHIKADGENWRFLKITGPGGIEILELQNRGPMRTTGGSEFFLEGAEPPVTVVPIAQTLAKFPAGTYSFVGQTVDGVDMLSKARFTHVVPAGPEIVQASPSVIKWKAVKIRHPDFPNPGGNITIVAYQVIVGSFQVTLPDTGADEYMVTLPPELGVSQGDGFEVLAIEKGGNQTITEGTIA
jgi:hypothetical protein